MKLDDFIKILFHCIIVVTSLIIILLLINKLCNNCIYKKCDTMLNPQGYSFDIKYNEVEPFDEYDKTSEEASKHPKVRFSKEKTTGFMTFISNDNLINTRSSS